MKRRKEYQLRKEKKTNEKFRKEDDLQNEKMKKVKINLYNHYFPKKKKKEERHNSDLIKSFPKSFVVQHQYFPPSP